MNSAVSPSPNGPGKVIEGLDQARGEKLEASLASQARARTAGACTRAALALIESGMSDSCTMTNQATN